MSGDEPVLRVVRGEPSAEELAALVTVIAARAAARPADEPSLTLSPWVASGLERGVRTRADW